MKLDVSENCKKYLSEGQLDLLDQGDHLLAHAKLDVVEKRFMFDDYSFIVFPFAKAYEGFLKQVFLDAGFIDERDYTSNHFRVGKVMSPNLEKRLGNRSVYKKICKASGCALADKIWNTWKKGRNLVFHYYPHNIKSLTLTQAEELVVMIVETMEETLEALQDKLVKSDEQIVREKLARLGKVR
ncbi:MAG: hypothetical protein ACE5DQ_00215 [Candidatus Paceibacterota bacterium]